MKKTHFALLQLLRPQTSTVDQLTKRLFVFFPPLVALELFSLVSNLLTSHTRPTLNTVGDTARILGPDDNRLLQSLIGLYVDYFIGFFFQQEKSIIYRIHGKKNNVSKQYFTEFCSPAFTHTQLTTRWSILASRNPGIHLSRSQYWNLVLMPSRLVL